MKNDLYLPSVLRSQQPNRNVRLEPSVQRSIANLSRKHKSRSTFRV